MSSDFTPEQVENLMDYGATPQEALHIEHLFTRLEEFLDMRILQASRSAEGHTLLSYYTHDGIHSFVVRLPIETDIPTNDENRPPLRELQNLP